MKDSLLTFATTLFVQIIIGFGLFLTILLANTHVYEMSAKIDLLNSQIHDLINNQETKKEIYENPPNFDLLSLFPIR